MWNCIDALVLRDTLIGHPCGYQEREWGYRHRKIYIYWVGTHGGRAPTTTHKKRIYKDPLYLMLYPPLYASIIFSLF